MRDILATPWGKDWPIVKREMVRCVELRRDDPGGVVQLASRSSLDLALPAPYRRNMNRRRFLLTSLAGAFAAPLAVEAQSANVYRIGILGESAFDPVEARVWQAFRLGLRELGWIEGQNIQIESRWAEGNFTRLPELAADLVRLKVDLIVTRGSTYVEGARKATSSIPIVFVMHADPERTVRVTA